MAWDCLFPALEIVGIPKSWVLLIQALYENGGHGIMLRGHSISMDTFNHGTKQGCPLSPVIFVLAIDVLITVISRRTSCILGGFADDLGIGLLSKEDWGKPFYALNYSAKRQQ